MPLATVGRQGGGVSKLAGAAIALALALTGCAGDGGRLCRPGERAAAVDTLYFGTAKGDAVAVKPDDWKAFVDEVATPRFPQGLTWWKARGQWRNGAGEVERERSYVLQITHPEAGQDGAGIIEVARQYRERFGQEAVLRASSTACVSFLKSGGRHD